MEVFVTCKATNVREIVEVDEEETVASLTAKAQKRLQCPPLIDVMLQTASGGSIGDGGTAVCNSPLEAGEALELVQMDPTPCEPCTPPKIRCPEGMPELQGFKSMLLCRAVTISDNNNVRHPRTLVIYEICGGKEFVIYLMKGVSVEQAVNLANIDKVYRQYNASGVPKDMFVTDPCTSPLMIEQHTDSRNDSDNTLAVLDIINQCRTHNLRLPAVECVTVAEDSDIFLRARQMGSSVDYMPWLLLLCLLAVIKIIPTSIATLL